jgi:hypothetical protein
MSRQIDPKGQRFIQGRSLRELSKVLGVNTSGLIAHDAINDARITQKVYEEEQKIAIEKGIPIKTYSANFDEYGRLFYNKNGGIIDNDYDKNRGTDRGRSIFGIGQDHAYTKRGGWWESQRSTASTGFHGKDDGYDRGGKGNIFGRGLEAIQTTLGKIGFANGGLIPGYGGGDRIPALLEAGEYVVNKQSANRYRGVLESINNGNTTTESSAVYMVDNLPSTERKSLNIYLTDNMHKHTAFNRFYRNGAGSARLRILTTNKSDFAVLSNHRLDIRFRNRYS